MITIELDNILWRLESTSLTEASAGANDDAATPDRMIITPSEKEYIVAQLDAVCSEIVKRLIIRDGTYEIKEYVIEFTANAKEEVLKSHIEDAIIGYILMNWFAAKDLQAKYAAMYSGALSLIKANALLG